MHAPEGPYNCKNPQDNCKLYQYNRKIRENNRKSQIPCFSKPQPFSTPKTIPERQSPKNINPISQNKVYLHIELEFN